MTIIGQHSEQVPAKLMGLIDGSFNFHVEQFIFALRHFYHGFIFWKQWKGKEKKHSENPIRNDPLRQAFNTITVASHG